MNRRSFLSLSWAGGAILLAAGGLFVKALSSMLRPQVFNEPPQQFKVGFPGDVPAGGPMYLPEQQVYFLRDEVLGFSAVSAVCPHLGCTVQFYPRDALFHCPCHGSKFSMDGRVLTGPAAKALAWYEVRYAQDGQLLVDKGRPVSREYHLALR